MHSYEKIISGEQSLLEWIMDNATEEGLDKDLPDDDSVAIAMPTLSGMSFVDGMLDGIMGKDEKGHAITLLEMFKSLAKIEINALTDDIINEYLGNIYMFIIQHRTLG